MAQFSKSTQLKRVAVLRSYPKDFAIGKVLTALSKVCEVDCYIWDRQGDYEPAVLNENLRYYKCSVRAGFHDLRTFLKLILFNLWLFWKLIFAKVDFIHAMDLDTGLSCLLMAKLKRIPFVYQCLDPYYLCLPASWPGIFGKWARRMENLVISSSELFILTDLLRMPQHEGSVPKRVLEFPNVPLLSVPNQKRHVSKEFVVGYIGSLVEGRNLITIIDAIGELRERGVKFFIGGFGPLEEDIAKRCRQYNNIDYKGWIPNSEVLKFESFFDVFVYMVDPKSKSMGWGSPNKLFESMALGKPIIVSEGTLVAKRVSSIGNGVIIKYGSKKEIQDTILKLKNDYSLVQKMGEMGQREFIQNWAWEIVEKRLISAYRDLGILHNESNDYHSAYNQ